MHGARTMSVYIALCVMAELAFAQQTTERFIPIGASPGISNISSYIGRIVAVDAEAQTVTVEEEDGSGRHALRVSAETHVWIDRSAEGRINDEGTFGDCEIGRRAEVSYVAGDSSAASWIKVEGG